MSRVNVAVAVADDARGRICEIAAACRALGLRHSATLALVGVLTGSMESDDLVKLWDVPGVLAIEGVYGFVWGCTGGRHGGGRGDFEKAHSARRACGRHEGGYPDPKAPASGSTFR